MICVGNAILAKWIPIQERSRACTLSTLGAFYLWIGSYLWLWCVQQWFSLLFLGYNIGFIVGPPLAGIISTYLGWQYCFYINGCLTLTVTLFWAILVTDTPEESSRVTADELLYISNNIISTKSDETVAKVPPYLEMAKSIKVWALVKCTLFI